MALDIRVAVAADDELAAELTTLINEVGYRRMLRFSQDAWLQQAYHDAYAGILRQEMRKILHVRVCCYEFGRPAVLPTQRYRSRTVSTL